MVSKYSMVSARGKNKHMDTPVTTKVGLWCSSSFASLERSCAHLLGVCWASREPINLLYIVVLFSVVGSCCFLNKFASSRLHLMECKKV
jgi:hypothetical protein